jgi:hypothetical protein
MRILTCVLIVAALLVASSAFAEGGCPSGQYPQQGNGCKSCVPVGGGQPKSVEDTFRGPTAEARWISLASDSNKGILGKGIDATSESEANDAALSECTQKGGTTCHLVGAVKNKCAAYGCHVLPGHVGRLLAVLGVFWGSPTTRTAGAATGIVGNTHASCDNPNRRHGHDSSAKLRCERADGKPSLNAG